MHQGRRIALVVGSALAAMILAFPVTVAAREHDVTIPPDVLGTHVWDGALCDGTPVSVTFHVTERGRIVFDSASGAPATVRSHRHRLRVRFDGTHTRMRAALHRHDGVVTLVVRGWTGHCDAPPPPTDPGTPPPDDGGNGQTG